MEIVRNDGEKSDRVIFQQLKSLELVSLNKLKSFCVSNCDFEFPSLEKLVVSACYNMAKFSETVTSSPILQNVHVVHGKDNKRFCWEGDINATIQKIFKEKNFFEGMEMSFAEHQNFNELCRCPQLQYLFTSSVVKKLVNLEEIIVEECESLKEIVAKEEDEDENEMIFMKLEYLTLISLDKFESFYTGNSTLNFSSLREVMVNQCLSTKIFRPRDKVPPRFRVVIDGFPYKGDKKTSYHATV